MLYLLGSWLLLIAASLPLGLAVLRWTAANAFDRAGDRLVLSIWLGVIVLGTALLALSLVFALTPLVGVILASVAVAAPLAAQGVREELRSLATAADPRMVIAFLAVAAGVAVFASQPVVWTDTGLYHVGTIRWLSEHGAVEGIGLLHHRFGFGSIWFALAAPFNSGELREHGAALMGGFALLMLATSIAICLSRALRREARAADWLMLAGAPVLLFSAAYKAYVSANPDIGVNVLTLVAGWTILVLLDRSRAPVGGGGPAAANGLELEPPPGSRLSPGQAAVPLLIGIGATAIKPQAAPVLLVTVLFFVLVRRRRLRSLAWIAALGIAFGAPWIAYQFITTGCPAFPLSACADVSWSVGSETAQDALGSIGRAGTRGSPFEERDSVESVANWLTAGLGALPLLALGSALVLIAGAVLLHRRSGSWTGRVAPWLVLAGAGGLLVFLIRADEIFALVLVAASLLPLGARDAAATWLLAIGVAGIALMLFAAPDPEFAYGYMAVLLGRLVVFFVQPRWERLWRPPAQMPRLPRLGLATLLLLAGIAAAIAPLAGPTTTRAEVVERFGLLLPPNLPQPQLSERRINDVRYTVPRGSLCWSSELPCAPAYDIDSEIKLRDPESGIAAGFAREPDAPAAGVR
jgi:hypothetical protein